MDLQIKPPPTPPYLIDVSGREMHDTLTTWIDQQHEQAWAEPSDGAGGAASPQPEDPFADAAEFFDAEKFVEGYREQAGKIAWTAADCPPLAAWVDANAGPLDLLVAAAARPKFYSPPPDQLENPNASLIAMLLPCIQEMRNASRSLNVRATYRVGLGDYDKAWQDCFAVWRLGDHAIAGPTLVERLVGIAMRGVARGPTLALLERDDLPKNVAQQVFDDLNSLAPRASMADATDRGERFMFMDSTIRMLTSRFGDDEDMGEYDEKLASLQHLSIDPNVPLRMGNEWYDRLVAAMRMTDRTARQAALRQVESDLDSIAQISPAQIFGNTFSRQARSTFVGQGLVELFLPALSAAVDAEDRDAANLTLTRIAAALAIFRARTGAYPETLAELVPSILQAVPADLYSNQPPIYRRRGTGYVLYSVFQNGVDDGGQDFSGEIIDGEWVDEDDPEMLDPKQSDYVIRIPRPSWRSPLAARSEDDEQPDDIGAASASDSEP
jgi:hypothetical protein